LQGAGNPYAHLPFFPSVSHIARAAFVSGTVDILRIAAVILAVGFLASAFLVRRADLQQEGRDLEAVAAA